MRSRALSCLVGGVLVSGAWLTGACGSTFVADMSQAGSGGAMASPAGRNSGGDASDGGPMHLNKGGSNAGGQPGGSGNVAGVGSSGAGGASGTSAGNGGGGASAGAGGAGAGGGGASGAGAGGGGAGGAGAGGGGASGAGAGGGGAGGAGAGGGGASGISGGGVGGALSCVASTVTWMGCQAPSCGACKSAPELVNHPLYFPNHPSCIAIASCPDAHSACGATCPPPSDADLCNGSPGQWSGCQGTGCYVCEELVAGYPKYFEHHPNCVQNGTCQGPGHYGTCNAFCPAPVAADM